MSDHHRITHVSDTAFWVGNLRAREAQRADAAFHDSFASLLSGERGRKIARSLPHSAIVAWSMVIRTSAIDQLINGALRVGIDTILNLGAGLDTRPYRMDLPAHLNWIEIDFPNIVELKNSVLFEMRPKCRLQRIAADLRNRSSCTDMLAEHATGGNNTLVITEGVITYLSNQAVAALAIDLYANPSIRYWIQDFDNAGPRNMPRGWVKKLKAAPFIFEVRDWFEFFENSGWEASSVITTAEESERLNRPFPWYFPAGVLMRALPKQMQKKILGLSGAVLMRKRTQP